MRSVIWQSVKQLTSNTTASRLMSQSTSIPRKQVRVRDHAYDDYMEIQKKVRKVLKFQDLILSQPNAIISVSRLDSISRRIGFKQFESGRFVLKFPHVFEVFEHPVQRILYCRLTRRAAAQIELEKQLSAARYRMLKCLVTNDSKLTSKEVRKGQPQLERR
ncbi:hypothetical protein SASPL_129405 [Salvia splendens]|uniref:PORR domain-containing protein n=1 Tax=Salvia splendens TaxID=180675 RepID=A0A8X8XD22_SALSN|nr:hypothetical protein SASPL_129405 [Salvia splendens]